MLKFGFIGLNDVAEALCINLLKRTNTMAFVNDNSIARVEYVGEHGAVSCELASDVAERADVIVLSNDNFVNTQAILYSIIGNLNSQKLLLDLSAISPSETLEIAEMLKQTGAEFADLAILNGFEKVESKQALLLYGGPSNVFLNIQEYLKFMCRDVIRIGDVSAAKTMKACYALLYSQIQNGVNEMFLLASKSGLILDNIVPAIQNSPAQNLFIEENAQKITSGKYTRKVDIKKIHKQLEIAHEHSLNKKTPMKGLIYTKGLYDSVLDRRLQNHDVTEIYTIVERASHG